MSVRHWCARQSIRADFPIFERKINGRPIVYLDNAATTQAPKSVISSINEHYQTSVGEYGHYVDFDTFAAAEHLPWNNVGMVLHGCENHSA